MRIGLIGFGLMMAAGPAVAAPAELSLNLRADVQPFCRLFTEAASVDERGQIGTVRELCNTPSGYSVVASFSNVLAGTVRADAEDRPIGEDGQAIFVSSEARHRTRRWELVDAQRRDASSPIAVRFTIMPL